jgi:gamma-glutamylcyclotransferase (GGCT)/AIG2-like uncharacterized protein YtfP
MAVNVFTYGSLMFEPVWDRVVQGRYRSMAARLFGYVRKKVRGQEYPAVIPGEAPAKVHGVLYLDVAPGDLERLDRFESPLYRRRQAPLLLPDGSRRPGFFYVFRAEFRGRLDSEDWDPQEFSRSGIQRFLAGYEGFGRSELH